MAASPYDRLLNNARIRLAGAIDETIRQELFNAASEFFRISGAWQDDIGFWINPGEREAQLSPLAGRIVRLVSVREAVDEPRWINGALMPEIGVVRLRHAPTARIEYVARVALTVSDPVTRDALPIIPVDIIERYQEELLDGLLSKMLSQPAKPYTNLQLAAYHNNRFRGGASRARNEVHAAMTQGSQRWAFPQTFNRR